MKPLSLVIITLTGLAACTSIGNPGSGGYEWSATNPPQLAHPELNPPAIPEQFANVATAEFASGELIILFQAPVLEVHLDIRASGGSAEIKAFDRKHNQVQHFAISEAAIVTLQANEISRVHVIGFKPHIFSIC